MSFDLPIEKWIIGANDQLVAGMGYRGSRELYFSANNISDRLRKIRFRISKSFTTRLDRDEARHSKRSSAMRRFSAEVLPAFS